MRKKKEMLKRRIGKLLFIFSVCSNAPVVVGQQGEVVTCPRVKRMYNGTKSNGNYVRLETKDPNGDRYGELSGLAFSPTQNAPSGDPVVYSMSDGGSGERIGLWDPLTGKRLRTLRIRNTTTTNWDWEALTIGTCGNTPGPACLYLADTGDNTARISGGRRSVRKGNPYRIIKIVEPMLEDFDDLDYIPDSYISILNIDYNHTSSPTRYADVEAMFIDHTGWGDGGAVGDIYLVTKWDQRRILEKSSVTLTRLFKIPPNVWPKSNGGTKGHYSPKVVGSADNYKYKGTVDASGRYTKVTSGQLMGMTWRGGEMSFDGTLIGLATTWNSTLFLRCPGQSVLEAMARPNAETKYCRLWKSPVEKCPGCSQVESFAFTPKGDRSLVVPEGTRPRLGWVDFDYDTGRVCPTPITSFRPTTSTSTARPNAQPTVDVQPSREPSKEPSQIPSSSPSIMVSSSPTKLPTSSPSESPGTRLTVAEDDSKPEMSKLGLCQGNCNVDEDCAAELRCFQRSEGMSRVPGCKGDANSFGGQNFCIQSSMIKVDLEILDETLWDNAFELCQGDCEFDEECAGQLVCYERQEGTTEIPDCLGDPDSIGSGKEGYCTRASSISVTNDTDSVISQSAKDDDDDKNDEDDNSIVTIVIIALIALVLLGLVIYIRVKIQKERAAATAGADKEVIVKEPVLLWKKTLSDNSISDDGQNNETSPKCNV